jgi:hypothetical protein
VAVLEVAVPREGHKYVGTTQQNDGFHGRTIITTTHRAHAFTKENIPS